MAVSLILPCRSAVLGASRRAVHTQLRQSMGQPSRTTLEGCQRCTFSTGRAVLADTTLSNKKEADKVTAPSQADDPWAIPMQHSGTLPDDIPVSHIQGDTGHPEGRDLNEPTETMRSRLVYQSRKRGILEMEMLLSTFIDSGKLKNMSREDMQQYDRLLTLPDWTIYYWIIGKKEIPEDVEWKDSKIIRELTKHAANEGKVVRKMPEIQSYGIKGASS